MSDSILNSTKKALDVPENYDVFNANIIMHINSALSTLRQIGVGPVDGFMIEDANATWSQLLGDDPRFNDVKQWVYLKVKQVWDPAQTQFLSAAMKENISELEYRMNVTSEFSTITTIDNI